jgi:hypothetical protein
METRVTSQSKAHASSQSSNKLYMLAAAGGAAFWITDFVMAVSPLAVAYKAAFSISSLPVALVEALAGGLMIAFCVSYFLLRFFDRIPGKNPIHKALILSFMNVPRFLALGIVVGHLYDKLNGGE